MTPNYISDEVTEFAGPISDEVQELVRLSTRAGHHDLARLAGPPRSPTLARGFAKARAEYMRYANNILDRIIGKKCERELDAVTLTDLKTIAAIEWTLGDMPREPFDRDQMNELEDRVHYGMAKAILCYQQSPSPALKMASA